MDFFGIDLAEAIKTAGYIGLFAIVFAETGLFLGFFFPGDSLLFIAGVLAAQGFFSFPLLVILLFIAAVLGNIAGYEFGKYVGPKIFTRKDSLVFHKSHVYKAQSFYQTHGPKTILLARFIPIVRTFAPIVAGVAKMRYPTFLVYNILGAAIWTGGIIGAAYYLGGFVEHIDRYLLPIVLAIIVVSFLPAVWHYIKEKRRARIKEEGGNEEKKKEIL